MAHRFLSEFKSYLGRDVTDTQKDFLLDLSLTAAEDFITTNYGITLKETTITDVVDGTGRAHLYLPYRVTSISSLVISEDTVDLSEVYIKAGAVRLIAGSFTEGVQNVTITYTTGWEDAQLPSALKAAMFSLGGKLFQDADEARGGVEGWNTNTKTGVDYVVHHLPPTFEKLVAPYRIVRF